MRRHSLAARVFRIVAFPLLAGCAFLISGCASTLSKAVSDLESGRPADADRRFRGFERDLATLDGSDRLRYFLYRGLTHLTLGDVDEAARWLSEAKRIADGDAHSLSNAERGRLLAAWRTMGRMPGDPSTASADESNGFGGFRGSIGFAPGTSATSGVARH